MSVRQNSESLVQLKGLCPDKKIPRGLLQEGNQAIDDVLKRFSNAI